jgi:hypothetical protein
MLAGVQRQHVRFPPIPVVGRRFNRLEADVRRVGNALGAAPPHRGSAVRASYAAWAKLVRSMVVGDIRTSPPISGYLCHRHLIHFDAVFPVPSTRPSRVRV